MINWAVKRIIGTKNQRELKKMQPFVAHINDLEAKFTDVNDDALREMTPRFRERLERGEDLDALLPEAFAVMREAARRVLKMRHYDVQMIGGIALHRGTIAEMKTGEGKTLVATLPVYLNALTGRGVHLVTVNDYLASRDAEWMGQVYRFLGLSVGTIYNSMPDNERQDAYGCDVVYGQNNEFGFDYLRDNMKDSIESYVQRELHYAIVDEVDSILIDEARTPLIISGPAEESIDLYHKVNSTIPALRRDVDYTVDEKAHSAMLTDSGVEAIEKRLTIENLYEPSNIEWLHHVQQALSAHTLYKRDVNYLVEGGKVVIIDEFTGRKMAGRRWSDGLHQAVEAKENVKIEQENQTLATITFQNYFRMYEKLGGMTGTAETEAEEFYKIYKLDVLVIPTNKPLARVDNQDVIYRTEAGKFRQVLEEIVDCHRAGQPVLVGTTSVEKSEVLAKLLRKQNIKHNVLNAKNHGREAEIVAQAGRKGAITLSTNMAGRGTDIVLGGNAEAMARATVDPANDPESYHETLARIERACAAEREEVLAAGGLHIIGTERHESRRIDNQLRGRAGRQGDKGSSSFYLSLEDDLLRIFGSERITGLMDRLGMSDDEPIEHRFVTKAIGNAQRKVEGHNFDIRKNLLEYDDVMNQQRKAIYAMRREVLEGRYTAPKDELDERRAGNNSAETGETEKSQTAESIASKLTQNIEAIVDSFFEPAEGAPDGSASVVDHRRLTHELYRYFGAVVDLRNKGRDRDACVVKAVEKITESLMQQRERLLDASDALIADSLDAHCSEKAHPEEWDIAGLRDHLSDTFAGTFDFKDIPLDRQAIADSAWKQVEEVFFAKEEELGLVHMLFFARHFQLDEIDNAWIGHLRNMDHLREGIGLRGYGQRDPKQEYKKEGYAMFSEMMTHMGNSAAANVFRIRLEEDPESLPEYEHRQRQNITLGRGQLDANEPETTSNDKPEIVKPIRRDRPRIGRNDPCYCGSGQKYKKCHMRTDLHQGSTDNVA